MLSKNTMPPSGLRPHCNNCWTISITCTPTRHWWARWPQSLTSNARPWCRRPPVCAAYSHLLSKMSLILPPYLAPLPGLRACQSGSMFHTRVPLLMPWHCAMTGLYRRLPHHVNGGPNLPSITCCLVYVGAFLHSATTIAETSLQFFWQNTAVF